MREIPDGRVEGFAKVTGCGKYAAEYKVDNQCYAVLVGSTIAAGKINNIDLSNARKVEGVIDIITHINKPFVPGFADQAKIKESRFGLPLFHTDTIFFKGQPIAMVIAETFEDATYAASLVTAEYSSTPSNVDFDKTQRGVKTKTTGKDRGSLEAWSNSPYIVDEEYNITNEVHNPM